MIVGEWKRTRLGDHIRTRKGYAFKSKWYSKKGIPLVKVSDFSEDSVSISELTRIPNEIAGQYKKYSLKKNDVIIQTVGSWPTNPRSVVGKAIKIPSGIDGALLNQNAVKIIPTPGLNNRYLFYLLRSNGFKNYIIGCAQGAANQASITLDSIKDYEFLLPSNNYQNKVAGILSCFDDLIDVNLRRIRILEEIAQSVYDEWFVHFRYPGYENEEIIQTPKKLIPKGWEISRVKPLLKRLKAGIVYRKGNVKDIGEVPVIDQSTDEYLGFHSNKPGHEASLENPIIIFGDHTCKMQLLTEPSSVGPNVVPFVSRDLPIYFAYYLLKDLVQTREYKRHWTELTNKEVIIPPLELCDRFPEFALPIFHQINLFRKKNLSLKYQRDTILPKIISGKINVNKLDIDALSD